MPVRNTLNKKLAATTLAVVIATEMMWGCALNGKVSGHSQYPSPFHAASLAQNGLGLAVWLEDQCESQEADEQSVTLFEALHDGLVVPTEAMFALSIVTVVGTAWSLYDRITLPAGELLPNRPQMVLEYVKPHRAGPTISARSQAEHIPIAWLGCSSAYGER